MTVEELVTQLAKLPRDMQVTCLSGDGCTDNDPYLSINEDDNEVCIL